jgi:hypothetical protein
LVGENPADIHIFFTFCCTQKIFYKISLQLFKTGKVGPGQLSKVVGAVLLTFQTRIVHRKHIWWVCKLARLALAGYHSSMRSSEKSVI